MDKIIKFLGSQHKENYLALISLYKGTLDKNIDNIFRLLSIDEVYDTSIKYVTAFSFNFNDLLKDSDLSNTGLFICELAYSLYSRNFFVNSLSSARKLNTDTRNYIINIINFYIPHTEYASGF